jgi:hypothetical protein
MLQGARSCIVSQVIQSCLEFAESFSIHHIATSGLPGVFRGPYREACPHVILAAQSRFRSTPANCVEKKENCMACHLAS